MYHFICNCVDCLENEDFLEQVAPDATMLAQLVEGDDKAITQDEFLSKCVVPESLKALVDKQDMQFGEDRGACWMYDPEDDIHYFFA